MTWETFFLFVESIIGVMEVVSCEAGLLDCRAVDNSGLS